VVWRLDFGAGRFDRVLFFVGMVTSCVMSELMSMDRVSRGVDKELTQRTQRKAKREGTESLVGSGVVEVLGAEGTPH
jgi:hypothetical protein